MGICQSNEKLNGIIDNQSSYEIIYHVSGSRKELTDYEEELNLAPKLGVGMEGVEFEGFNINKKRFGKNEKYHSVARIPKYSFCSVGLNDIEVGCFLSIYAAKLNTSGKEVYKKLIFKDICIRTNEDICLRINKDLTLKQLTPFEITTLKECIKKEGSTMISTFKEKSEIIKSELEESNLEQQANNLRPSNEYVNKKFGQLSQRYLKFQETGLFDLNHIGVKIDMEEFLKYDWAYLQSLQLDNCGIDDGVWFMFCSSAEYYFPNLKNLYLADNKITTILEDDLTHFPSLKIVELDYSEIQGINPLTEESKRNLFNFAIEHPEIQIFCASIDESKYMDFNYQNFNQIENNDNNDKNIDNNDKNDDLSELPSSEMEDFEEYLKENPQLANLGWFLFFPPGVNSTREETEEIKQSKIGSKNKK